MILSHKNLLFCALAVALMALGAFVAYGPPLRADKSVSFITYRAHHTLHSWEGTSKKVDCLLVIDSATKTITKVAAATQVATFDSQNASRDSHGLEVLEAMKFPKVSFLSTNVVQKDSLLAVKGNLTFHGVTKPVAFAAVRRDVGITTTVQGSFTISLTEFGVERPSFMMVMTEDNLEIELKMVFKQ